MSYLQLQSHVGYGIVGDRAVFLDLRGDRYLALDGPTGQALRELLTAAEPVLPDEAVRNRLLGTGLFRESSLRGRLAPTCAPTPSASILDDTVARPRSWTAPLRAWASVSRARKRLATVPLFEIVDAIRESRYAAPPVGDAGRAEYAARVFLAARAMVPIERSCLLDSLALLDWLGDEAGHAALVFGVRMDPFGAHSWVQTERLLLTDACDTIGGFVPVLSV